MERVFSEWKNSRKLIERNNNILLCKSYKKEKMKVGEKMDLNRIKKTLNNLNYFGALENGITRLAYTEDDQKARNYIIDLCKQEGLEVRIDECGNIFARRKGAQPSSTVVACGSHIDTVIEGGQFDGSLGVVAALEVIRSLNEKKIQTKHPIELIVFACEESSRFGYSTLGSKAIAGFLDIEAISHLKDKENISVEEAFKKFDLDFNNIHKAKQNGQLYKAFLELHIEQGVHLEKKKKEIGVVTGIAAPTRIKVYIKGTAAHSGSTAMDFRKDALTGASEITLELEKIARKESSHGTVATVGVLEVGPGAMNVIPGLVKMQIDIRGIDKDSKERVLKHLYKSLEKIHSERDLEVEWEIISDESPVLLNKEIIHTIEETCIEEGFNYEKFPSGAGHDAMNMAKICPTGMIFVPSKDGLSHNPDEYTSWEDISKGTLLLEKVIEKLAIPIKG